LAAGIRPVCANEYTRELSLDRQTFQVFISPPPGKPPSQSCPGSVYVFRNFYIKIFTNRIRRSSREIFLRIYIYMSKKKKT